MVEGNPENRLEQQMSRFGHARITCDLTSGMNASATP